MKNKVLNQNLFSPEARSIFAKGLFFVCLYALSAIGSLKFATINASISPIWPPTGLAISFLLIFGPRYFYCVFLGALAANYYISDHFASAGLIAVGNCLEAVFGYFVFHWVSRHLSNYDHVKNLLAILISTFTASMFSASVGTLTLLSLGSLSVDNLSAAWLTWWIGDSVGALIIVPLAVFYLEETKGSYWPAIQRALFTHRFTALFSAACLVGAFYFLNFEASLKFIFAFFPLLLLFSKLKNKSLVYTFSACLVVMTIHLTISGKGPFIHSAFNQNLLNLEIFIVGEKDRSTEFFLL